MNMVDYLKKLALKHDCSMNHNRISNCNTPIGCHYVINEDAYMNSAVSSVY